jgi:hypothetical protein
VLHQFVFCVCQKKAVPLHRISNNNLRMKTVIQNPLIRMVFFLLGLVSLMLMFWACSPIPPVPNPPTFEDDIPNSGGTSYREFAVADIPSDKLPYILADTITPPSNPMAPVDLSQYPTFVGTLQMFQISGIEDLIGQYFCGIRLHTPIMIDGYEYSIMYLLNYYPEVLIRFDHPMLESCVVGDTIYVTGEPKAISGGVALGVTMRYVQPK